jgi:hypothetical protein
MMETPMAIPQMRRVSATTIGRTPSPLSQTQPLSVPHNGPAQEQSWIEVFFMLSTMSSDANLVDIFRSSIGLLKPQLFSSP